MFLVNASLGLYPDRLEDREANEARVGLLERAEPAQLRIVVVHQPVDVTRAEEMSNRLRGHAAALDRWAAAGSDLVMGGHIHLPDVTRLKGLARLPWAAQAGTAVSSRVREGVPTR